ncbi:MAG: endo-1,4-beta-xylanase [Oscillospiraceae bacterium]|nr:endo-1,4-beta-xylanase [Oscillospiraceae bacterium]
MKLRRFGVFCAAVIAASSFPGEAASGWEKIEEQHDDADGICREYIEQDSIGMHQLTLAPGGAFSVEWDGCYAYAVDVCRAFPTLPKWTQYSSFSIEYEADVFVEGNAFFGAHGWMKDTLTEFFVVEGWGTWRPPGSANTTKTITVNGSQYGLCKTLRVNQPSIEGVQTYPQLWSVRMESAFRRETKSSIRGTIDMQEHLRAWSSCGYITGTEKMESCGLYLDTFGGLSGDSKGSLQIKQFRMGSYYSGTASGPPEEKPKQGADENGVVFRLGFEDDEPPVTFMSMCDLMPDPSYYAEGTQSMYVSGRAECWDGLSVSLAPYALQPGGDYMLQAAVLPNCDVADTFRIVLGYEDADGEPQFVTVAERLCWDWQWTELCGVFTMPDLPDGVDPNRYTDKMYVFIESNGVDNYYADCFTLAEADADIWIDLSDAYPPPTPMYTTPAAGETTAFEPGITTAEYPMMTTMPSMTTAPGAATSAPGAVTTALGEVTTEPGMVTEPPPPMTGEPPTTTTEQEMQVTTCGTAEPPTTTDYEPQTSPAPSDSFWVDYPARDDSQPYRQKQNKDYGYLAGGSGFKDLLGPYFRIGGTLNTTAAADARVRDFYQQHFNSVTCESEMNPAALISSISGTDVAVDLRAAKRILQFAEQNGIGVRGHAFLWNSQTPEEMFAGTPEESDARIACFIEKTFAQLREEYPGLKLYAYDVCDGMLRNDGSGLRGQEGAAGDTSPWAAVYGDDNSDFIVEAFRTAREYAPADCKLFLSEDNEYRPAKTETICNLARRIMREGDYIDGIGMQSHLNVNEPNKTTYESAFKKIAALGLDIQITELEITGTKQDAAKQRRLWKDVFSVAMTYADQISSVTLRNPLNAYVRMSDSVQNSLFSEDMQPIRAYYDILDLTDEIEPPVMTERLPDKPSNPYLMMTEPEEQDLLPGDADCSGTVDIADVVLILRYVNGDREAKITDQGLRNANVNGDAQTDVMDAVKVLRMTAKKENIGGSIKSDE